MLKILVDKPKVMSEMEGSVREIINDFLHAVTCVYNGFRNNSIVDAELFRRVLIHSLREDSPVWQCVDGAVTIDLGKKSGGAPTGQS